MYITIFFRKKCFLISLGKWMLSFGLVVVFQAALVQTFYSQQYYQPQYSTNYQQNNQNYLRDSQGFSQKIARFQLTIVREGKETLLITQIPRVQQVDLLKVKLLDEAVGGLKPDGIILAPRRAS